MPRSGLTKREFAIHRDHALSPSPRLADLDASPARTLSPASTGAVNSMHGRGSSAAAKHALARAATIRSVASVDGSDSSPESRRSAFASSVNSTVSGASPSPAAAMAPTSSRGDKTPPPAVRLKHDAAAADPPPAGHRWSANGVRAVEPAPDSSLLSDAAAEPDAAQWDSTIGKAGLGKTGRVINKLVSDNDALKRDIQIERLRADEARQAARLVEDKMERAVSDYEGRLLEANVTKALLARKERQVETLTATVEAEKAKAAAALQREKSWRHELDKVRSDSSAQVDEATSYAQLMEGRYNAISSHWRDQGDQVKRLVAKMRADMDALAQQRRADDDRIQTLRDLCEQQDSNIKQLRRDKDDMARLFDRYKQTQEDDLRAIRADARAREAEQERLLHESREALAKLRWALNVKENVRDAR